MKENTMTVRSVKYRKFNYYGALSDTHDFYELIMVLSGTQEYRCRDFIINLREGDALLVMPGSLHVAKPGDFMEADTEFVTAIIFPEDMNINFPADARFLQFDVGEYLPMFRSGIAALRTFEETPRGMRGTLIEGVLKTWSAIWADEICRSLDATVCYKQNEIVMAVSEFIRDNYKEDITIDILTKKFFVSASYLGKIFKEYTNLSPAEAVIRSRIITSSADLIDTDKQISEISQDYGYPNTVAFYKAFYKRMGCSPSDFRRQYRQSPLVRGCIYTIPDQQSRD